MKPARDSSRRLRKSSEAVEEFLDRLDETAAAADVINARRSDRYRYRVQSLEVELQQAGTGWVRYEVPSRNLSREGAAFLLGHFIYPGTLCRIQLVTPQNERQMVKAGVVRCRYVEGSGTLHEVGVKFHKTIDVGLFCGPRARPQVMLVDDDPSMHRLIGHWSKMLDVDLTHLEGGRQAVELVTTTHFDIVLLDLEMPEFNGFDTARELRQRGFTGTIVALSALTDENAREECLTAGCTSYLAKPITQDALVNVIESRKADPLVSSLAEDPEMAELIDAFVTELPDKVAKLEAACDPQDFGELARIVRMLKGEGGAYSFQSITDAAAEVEKAINEQLGEDEIRNRLKELIRVCSSARSTRCSATDRPSAAGSR